MTPERHRLIEALSEAALLLDPSQRDDFLERACGSDADLRMRVNELVRCEAPPASFLDSPALDSLARDIAELRKQSLVGCRIGRYRIVSHLGSGGMGDVWLADDQELNRQVALKVLSPEFAGDSEHARRFRQEARAASSLNHPNLVTIFDIGLVEGRQFIAQEHIPGKTLREALRDGPLDPKTAAEIAGQVTAGLSAAHGASIAHRDIKPENIMIRPDGLVKVLDFGMARFLESGSRRGLKAANSALTRAGLIVGTVRYMSPEQARGNEVDGRTDIFSLGVVLYEMLAGMPPFAGATAADVLAAILTATPPPLSAPPELERIVVACLEKDAAARYASADALREELARFLRKTGSAQPERAGGIPERASGSGGRGRSMRVIAVAAVLAIAAGIGGIFASRGRQAAVEEPAAEVRSTLSLPRGHVPEMVVISPKGDEIVYQVSRSAVPQLYRRRLDEEESRLIPDSEGATQPFFSPDGKEIGFYAPTSLRISGAGGARDLARVPPEFAFRRAIWADDQFVYYTTPASGIWRVPARGGTPEPVVRSAPADRSVPFDIPQQLLTGNPPALLFSTIGGPVRRQIAWTGIAAGSRPHLLLDRAMGGQLVPGGYLIYYWRGKLFAAPFDPRRRELAGSPVEAIGKLASNGWWGPNASVSRNGTLVYIDGKEQPRRLTWVDHEGRESALPIPSAAYEQADVSPDGSKLAIVRRDAESLWTLWIYDLRSGAWTRLLEVDVPRPRTTWSPDGKSVVVAWTQGEAQFVNLYRIPIARPEAPERLTEQPNYGQFPSSWSAAARAILFVEGSHTDTQTDIFALRVDGPAKPYPLVATGAIERSPAFSPDGRWFAYTSDAGKGADVFVQRFDQSSPPRQVTTGGGMSPVWSHNGKRIYYLTPSRTMMELSFDSEQGATGRARVLFPTGSGDPRDWWTRGYSMAPGGRFLVIQDVADQSAVPQIHVIVNWTQGLKRLAPVGDGG